MISDANSRKAFDVFNIVNNKYNFESIICANKNNLRLSLIYFKQVHRLRTKSYRLFDEDLTHIENLIDSNIIYLPVSEKVTILFYEYISKNKDTKFKYLLPNFEKFNLARNKLAFQDYCSKNDIDVPRSYKINQLNKFNFSSESLIMKPNVGSGSVGIFHVKNKNDLLNFIKLKKRNYLIQRKIKNSQVFGVFVFSKNGKVLKSFSHKRIRTFQFRAELLFFLNLN